MLASGRTTGQKEELSRDDEKLREARRPDVTCLHPVTRVKWVLDVVTFWGESAGMEEGGWAKM
eukprot:SAG11_NODE_26814_length_340_cov_1.070539_1_plen_62_part_10